MLKVFGFIFRTFGFTLNILKCFSMRQLKLLSFKDLVTSLDVVKIKGVWLRDALLRALSPLSPGGGVDFGDFSRPMKKTV